MVTWCVPALSLRWARVGACLLYRRRRRACHTAWYIAIAFLPAFWACVVVVCKTTRAFHYLLVVCMPAYVNGVFILTCNIFAWWSATMPFLHYTS